jgi:hypothetical protein
MGFLDRVFTFLTITAKHHHKVIFVFFDDCWKASYRSGKQPSPIPGIHNSQWVQCPGDDKTITELQLRAYVQDTLKMFGKDARVLMWDLYNEPGNSDHGNASLPLLQNAFTWAR